MRIVRDIVLALFALTIALALVVGGVLFGAKREAATQMTALQQAGKPTSLKETVNRKPAPEVSSQGAPKHHDPAALLAATLEIPEELLKDEPWDAQQCERAREFLARYRALLDALHSGAYDLVTNLLAEIEGGTLTTQELAKRLLELSADSWRIDRLLKFETRLALLDGRTVDALSSLQTRLGFVQHHASVPFAKGILTQSAVSSAIFSDLAALMSEHALTEEQLLQMQRQTAQLDVADRAVRFINEERAFFLQGVEEGREGNFSYFLAEGIVVRGAANDFTEAEAVLQQAPSVQRAYATVAGTQHPLLDIGTLLRPHVFQHSLRSLVGISLRNQADIRATTAGLAVERYRLAEGRLPDNLEQTVPRFLDAVPTDPCDGAPLRYRQQDGGFVVYSVGLDGVDDSASAEQGNGTARTGDIAFRVTQQEKTLDSGENA